MSARYTAAPMNPGLSFDSLRSELARAVRDAVEKDLGATIERVVLERPPKVSLGDLATPIAFDLAKSLRRAPRAT